MPATAAPAALTPFFAKSPNAVSDLFLNATTLRVACIMLSSMFLPDFFAAFAAATSPPDISSFKVRTVLITLFLATIPSLLRCVCAADACRNQVYHILVPARPPDSQHRTVCVAHLPDLLRRDASRRVKCCKVEHRVALNQFFAGSSSSSPAIRPSQVNRTAASSLTSRTSISTQITSYGSVTPSAVCSSGSCNAGQHS